MSNKKKFLKALNEWFEDTTFNDLEIDAIFSAINECIAPFEFYDPKEAVGVYQTTGTAKHNWLDRKQDKDGYIFGNYPTRKALLINIEPIEKDSAEKLVADIANGKYAGFQNLELLSRAKALLQIHSSSTKGES